MTSTERDSYTGQPLVEGYVSKIPGIREPKKDFWRGDLSSAEYSAIPRAEGWMVQRNGEIVLLSGQPLFPPIPNEEAARRTVDWLVLNDGSVGVVLHWLTKGQVEPYFRLLDHLLAVITDEGAKHDKSDAILKEALLDTLRQVDSSTGDDSGSVDVLRSDGGQGHSGRDSGADHPDRGDPVHPVLLHRPEQGQD